MPAGPARKPICEAGRRRRNVGEKDAVETGTKAWPLGLGDQEFAREFLLAAMDEGVPIQARWGT